MHLKADDCSSFSEMKRVCVEFGSWPTRMLFLLSRGASGLDDPASLKLGGGIGHSDGAAQDRDASTESIENACTQERPCCTSLSNPE